MVEILRLRYLAKFSKKTLIQEESENSTRLTIQIIALLDAEKF